MSSESRQTSCSSSHREHSNQSAQSSSGNLLSSLGLQPIRRSFDLRRPVMSQPARDVIDLTADPSSPAETQTPPPASTHTSRLRGAHRPPRFERNIISIDEQEHETVDLREESPEIQFLTSRPRSRSLSSTRRRRRAGHTPARSPVRRPQVAVRISGEANGDRRHHHGATRPGLFHWNPFTRLTGSLAGADNDEFLALESFGPDFFRAPVDLDFLQAGFNYEHPSRPQTQPRLPTYDAPPPAQDGFTRSPQEDDILVCPNCDDELGVGEDDLKRQVWVVKACGHVRLTIYDPAARCMLIRCTGLLWRMCEVQICQQQEEPTSQRPSEVL